MKQSRGGSRRVAMIGFSGDEKLIAWDVKADTVRSDATVLANRLVPSHDNSELLLDEGARAILATCIVRLQTERPGRWTLFDLVASTKRDDAALRLDAERYYPTAVEWLSSEGRLLDAVWTTLQVAMAAVGDGHGFGSSKQR